MPQALGGGAKRASREHRGDAQHDDHKRDRAPPVLPECRESVAAFSSGPKHTEHEQQGTKRQTHAPHIESVVLVARGEAFGFST